MAPNPTIMKAVEQLGYRVTVGDVAAQTGLEINFAQQGLLTLASEANGHLQVANSGEIAYLFPKNFRAVLRNKYLQLKLQEWWEKIWRVLFYLIRISFGIVLIASIFLILIAISVILIAMSIASENENSGEVGGRVLFFPFYWIGDIFWLFTPGYDRDYRPQQESSHVSETSELNFLEAVFSFLFGDGNPNKDLEKRRWQEIGNVIRNSGGAIVAEQIAPYLDNVGQGSQRESEDYILPVLTKFDGRPEVSPEGEIVYHFPELQTTAKAWKIQAVPEYLRERFWRFSKASSGQVMLSMGLGAVNLIGALVLGSLLKGGTAVKIARFLGFVNSIYWILLIYGVGFLTIPLIRYFWIQWKNSRVEERNHKRQKQAILLEKADATLDKKIAYAQQFAVQNVIEEDDLVYTSEQDLLEQEIDRKTQIDAEWKRRLNEGNR